MNITAPANGNIAYSQSPSVVNSYLLVTCDYGYVLIGDQVRDCQSNGNWSGTEATCECKLKISSVYFLIGQHLFITHRISACVSS